MTAAIAIRPATTGLRERARAEVVEVDRQRQEAIRLALEKATDYLHRSMIFTVQATLGVEADDDDVEISSDQTNNTYITLVATVRVDDDLYVAYQTTGAEVRRMADRNGSGRSRLSNLQAWQRCAGDDCPVYVPIGRAESLYALGQALDKEAGAICKDCRASLPY